MPGKGLDDLYREVIIDHSKEPHHREPLSQPDLSAEGRNPLCGDEITVQAVVRDGKVAGIYVGGQGCAISQASGSIMSDMVEGLSLEEAKLLAERFERSMKGENVPELEGDIEAFKGARKFPARIKCATLAWHTLEEAIASGRIDPKEGT